MVEFLIERENFEARNFGQGFKGAQDLGEGSMLSGEFWGFRGVLEISGDFWGFEGVLEKWDQMPPPQIKDQALRWPWAE